MPKATESKAQEQLLMAEGV